MPDSASAAAFEALLQRTGGSLLLLVDPRMRIRRAGAGATQLTGRPAETLAGMSLIAASGSATLDALARSALDSGEVAGGDVDLGHLGGRSFAVEAIPVPGDGLVLSLHEITELRRVERVRRDFVANISHELRTPLASIKLLAETLAAGAVDDRESAHEFATQIQREVDHLAQLVDELLELARIESGEMALAVQPVKPSALIATLAERIRPVADRRGMTVRVVASDPSANEPQAAADPERLGQALLNLASNAVKYSHPGGEIRLGWVATDGGVRLEVADDGIGIPASHQARIFERFYKVDRSRTRPKPDAEGTRASAGLGLAIVRHIVETHGGTVGVRSVERVGSTFWIEVPRA